MKMTFEEFKSAGYALFKTFLAEIEENELARQCREDYDNLS